MTDKVENTLSKTNRYSSTPIYEDDFVAPGRIRFGLWRFPELRTRSELDLEEGTFTEYTVKESDIGRLDLIAYQYYEDSSFWFVIALVNKVQNLLSDMYVGQVLKIPDKTLVVDTMREGSASV